MKDRLNTPVSAYPEPLDAVVLAGTHQNPRRLILGRNKAFLEIGGKALVRRVVEALVGSRAVGQIFVVGPLEQLKPVFAGLSGSVTLVPQEGKMMKNAWAGIYAAEAYQRGQGKADDPKRPLLALSCDLPIISSQAVDDFIARCAKLDAESEDGYSILCLERG